MSDPRDHHFIPASFIKRWADGDGKVTEFRQVHGKLATKRRGPKATGKQFELYTIDGLPDEAKNFLERFCLSNEDNLGLEALRKLVRREHGPWTPIMRLSWSRFLFGLLHRHPDVMLEIKAAAAKAWSVNTHPENTEDMTDDLYHLLFGNNLIGGQIVNMQWEVITAKSSTNTFLLSDWPLQILPMKNETIIIIPIGPKDLFMAATSRRLIDRVSTRDAESIVRDTNRMVVSRARRYVWDRDLRQLRFVKNHFGTNRIAPPLSPPIKWNLPRGQATISLDEALSDLRP